MWHLIEDFFDQGLVMKGMLGLGWLCVLIMIASFVFGLPGLIESFQPPAPAVAQ